MSLTDFVIARPPNPQPISVCYITTIDISKEPIGKQTGNETRSSMAILFAEWLPNKADVKQKISIRKER